jgi:flagellar protein FliS
MNPYSGQASAAYRQAARAVHPTVAVVKVYDEALLALTQAIRAREAGEYETCFSRVLRAATVLRGLAHCLDFAKGGAVAERLEHVYKSYILALHLNYGKPDAAARYGKLFEGLVELRDAWAGIAGMRPYAQVASLGDGEAAFRAAAERSSRLRADPGPAAARRGAVGDSLEDPIFSAFPTVLVTKPARGAAAGAAAGTTAGTTAGGPAGPAGPARGRRLERRRGRGDGEAEPAGRAGRALKPRPKV